MGLRAGFRLVAGAIKRAPSEDELQAQLDGARAARSKHGVGADNIGSGREEPETRARSGAGIRKAGLKSSGAAFRVRDVCMIEDVEELSAELSGHALPEPEGLGDRHIHVVVRQPAENIVACGAVAAIRRRYQNRLAVGVAAQVGSDATA